MRAALNAEMRKEKSLLQQEVENLRQMIQKKGLSNQDIEDREEKFEEVQREVDAIDDGLGSAVKSPSRMLTSPSNGARNGSSMKELKGSLTYDGAYTHTTETQKFVKDAAAAQERQDVQLESIERGVSTLKEIGTAMGEELERHDVVIDEIEEKMDVVTREIQTNNMKLKGVLNQVRTTRKFFIDIILICILLAVGLYIYNMFA